MHTSCAKRPVVVRDSNFGPVFGPVGHSSGARRRRSRRRVLVTTVVVVARRRSWSRRLVDQIVNSYRAADARSVSKLGGRAAPDHRGVELARGAAASHRRARLPASDRATSGRDARRTARGRDDAEAASAEALGIAAPSAEAAHAASCRRSRIGPTAVDSFAAGGIGSRPGLRTTCRAADGVRSRASRRDLDRGDAAYAQLVDSSYDPAEGRPAGLGLAAATRRAFGRAAASQLAGELAATSRARGAVAARRSSRSRVEPAPDRITGLPRPRPRRPFRDDNGPRRRPRRPLRSLGLGRPTSHHDERRHDDDGAADDDNAPGPAVGLALLPAADADDRGDRRRAQCRRRRDRRRRASQASLAPDRASIRDAGSPSAMSADLGTLGSGARSPSRSGSSRSRSSVGALPARTCVVVGRRRRARSTDTVDARRRRTEFSSPAARLSPLDRGAPASSAGVRSLVLAPGRALRLGRRPRGPARRAHGRRAPRRRARP